MLRYYAGPEFVDALKNAPKKYDSSIRKPIVKLIEELGTKKLRRVFIQNKNFSLVVKKGE